MSNSDPWGCSGARVMTIFGSHVGPYFSYIGYFEVYGDISKYITVFYRYLEVYEGI